MVDAGMWWAQHKAAQAIKEANAEAIRARRTGEAWRRDYQNKVNAIKRAKEETPRLREDIPTLRKQIEELRGELPERLSQKARLRERRKFAKTRHKEALAEIAERQPEVDKLDALLQQELEPFFEERQKLRTECYVHHIQEQLAKRLEADVLDPLITAAEKLAGVEGSGDRPVIEADTSERQVAVKSMRSWLEALFPAEVFWKKKKGE